MAAEPAQIHAAETSANLPPDLSLGFLPALRNIQGYPL